LSEAVPIRHVRQIDANGCGVAWQWHFVVLLADGRVLDPLDYQPKDLTAWPEVAYMFGVWRVA
jgi:hypothetical protein